jgi:Ca-activated chloride channel family protein
MTWADTNTWLIVSWAVLATLSLAALIYGWRSRWRHAPGLRFPARHRMQGVRRGWRAHLAHAPFMVRSVAVLLVLFAVSRPQLTAEETAEVEGIDIVVAFDMSGSMAQVDVSDEALVMLQNKGEEPRDRFSNAVDVLREFVRSRRYDRVSLVIFGKEAFLQFPLTLDYGVMLNILDRMSLGDIDGSGTAIGNALAMSVARLRESEAKTQLVILITDGEDNGSQVSPTEMATEAAQRGIKVFPILVGNEEQTRQPTEMVDVFSGQKVYQKVDNRINPTLLKEIAEIASGRFYRATDREQLANDFHDILDEFEKSRLVDYAAAEKTEIYHWFLIPGLLLLGLEVLLSQTILRRYP